MIEENEYEPEEISCYDRCPTCNGRGTVNPLTAPDHFFCTGTTDCPDCDGIGKI